MEETVKPEVQVIADNLRWSYTSNSHRVDESTRIWAALIDYWMNRSKSVEKDSPQYTEPNSITSPFDARTPYIHGGSAKTYDFPFPADIPTPETTVQDYAEEEKLDQYAYFISFHIGVIEGQLQKLMGLPCMSKSDNKQIAKALEHLERVSG